MKTYVKPSVNVIELQLNENIAAVPTTVYKSSTRTQGTASAIGKTAYNMALGMNLGLSNNDYAPASEPVVA